MADSKLKPTPAFLDHLVEREDSIPYVYKDNLGKPTAGIGHLITNEYNLSNVEWKKIEGYNVPIAHKDGTPISVGNDQIMEWFAQDSEGSFSSAIAQAEEAGIHDMKFIEALASVNFQLGPGWNKGKRFPKAWEAIKKGDFIQAVKEINESDQKGGWKRDTPTRAEDFIHALEAYGRKVKPQDYAIQEWNKEDDPFGLYG